MSAEDSKAPARQKSPWVLHPLLVGIPAILDFTYSNRSGIDPSQALFPIGLTALVAALLTLALSVPLKSLAKAGLMVSLLVIGFHHHGHVMSEWRIPMWIGIGIGCLLFGRWRWSLDVPTSFANAFATVAILFPTYQLFDYQRQPHDPMPRADYLTSLELKPQLGEQPPNIYFILLDGYGREDVMRSRYGFENPLNAALRDLDFHVIEGAHSNYSQTAVSLASALNLDYVDSLIDVEDPLRARYRLSFKRLIEQNRTTTGLKKAGYQIANYRSEYSLSSLDGVDRNYGPWPTFTEYEYLLANNTALLPATALLGLPKARGLHGIRRRQIQWVFDNLQAAESSPTFSFVHIVAPHPPFVFEPDGSYRTSDQKLTFADGSSWVTIRGSSTEDYAEGYLAQLQYTTNELVPALKRVIAEDPRAAVFLFSDHGPGKNLDWSSSTKTDVVERLAIHLAVRLPDSSYENFYESMTTVNAFRAFLNEAVGTELPLLEDHSYYMRWSRPCQYVEVDRRLKSKAPWVKLEEPPKVPKVPNSPWEQLRLRILLQAETAKATAAPDEGEAPDDGRPTQELAAPVIGGETEASD